MRQFVYHSITTRPDGRPEQDLPDILRSSVGNNGINGVTGLLYIVERHFLQVIEGPEESIEHLVMALRNDARHSNMVVCGDRLIGGREFGEWSMLYRQPSEDRTVFDERMQVALARASGEIASRFRAM